MMRRVLFAASVAAIAATVACGSDQSTNNPPPPPTSAALALHFDTLAGALQASSPGDIRLTWYQDIASILARGVSPSGLSALVEGGPAVFSAATEVDEFPDTLNGKVADSSYRLAAWAPSTRPMEFVDIRVRFWPAGVGKTDTTTTYVKVYTDTLGRALVDSTEGAAPQALSSRGTCMITPLAHLTVPSNPCSKVAVEWVVGGGTALLVIDPAVQVSGTHLTH
jgi:hypothetical protein